MPRPCFRTLKNIVHTLPSQSHIGYIHAAPFSSAGWISTIKAHHKWMLVAFDNNPVLWILARVQTILARVCEMNTAFTIAPGHSMSCWPSSEKSYLTRKAQITIQRCQSCGIKQYNRGLQSRMDFQREKNIKGPQVPILWCKCGPFYYCKMHQGVTLRVSPSGYGTT